MKLEKVKNTFNDYKLEISYGQLMAIKASLEQLQGDVQADELLAEMDWYLNNVPGPGQSEEEFEQATTPTGAPSENGDDVPVEMPPHEGAADIGAGPEMPPEEGEEMAGALEGEAADLDLEDAEAGLSAEGADEAKAEIAAASDGIDLEEPPKDE